MESSTKAGTKRVIRGSSMGLPHSGFVCVLVFLYKQDLNGTGIARRAFQRRHGVLLYLRYIDNLLFVCDAHCVPTHLVSELANIGDYKTKLEETGFEGGGFVGLSGHQISVVPVFGLCAIRANSKGQRSYVVVDFVALQFCAFIVAHCLHKASSFQGVDR